MPPQDLLSSSNPNVNVLLVDVLYLQRLYLSHVSLSRFLVFGVGAARFSWLPFRIASRKCFGFATKPLRLSMRSMILLNNDDVLCNVSSTCAIVSCTQIDDDDDDDVVDSPRRFIMPY